MLLWKDIVIICALSFKRHNMKLCLSAPSKISNLSSFPWLHTCQHVNKLLKMNPGFLGKNFQGPWTFQTQLGRAHGLFANHILKCSCVWGVAPMILSDIRPITQQVWTQQHRMERYALNTRALVHSHWPRTFRWPQHLTCWRGIGVIPGDVNPKHIMVMNLWQGQF